jgi:copper chaperone CopZ
MKPALTIILLAVVFLVTPSCRQQDLRQAVIHVPAMDSPEKAFEVKRVLSASAGVLGETVEVDMEQRTVRLTYESLVTALKNLEFAVSQAGYAANSVPAHAIHRE